MKRIFALLVCAILISCSKKENNQFELEIISSQLFVKQKQSIKNILRYKLTNKSNKTYYFNQFPQSKILGKSYDTYLFLTNSSLVIQDSKNDSIKVRCGIMCYNFEYSSFLDERLKPIRDLGYTKHEEVISYSKNFVIHPEETIFFEELIYLSDGKNHCNFNTIEEKCLGSIFMFSDSTKYKSVISTPALQTIRQNNYIVFHGVIKSKNKIPVKILR
jgi:hypothetical protein